MRRSRTAAIGMTHALTSLRRDFKGFHFSPCAFTLSWRRQGQAPPAGKKSPLKKAISKFVVRAQRTALMRMTHASPPQAKGLANRGALTQG